MTAFGPKFVIDMVRLQQNTKIRNPTCANNAKILLGLEMRRVVERDLPRGDYCFHTNRPVDLD